MGFIIKKKNSWGKAFGLAAKTPVKTPASYTTILRLDFQFYSQFQLPTNAYHRKQQEMDRVVGSLSPTQEIRSDFLDPGFGLIQSWSLWASGQWTSILTAHSVCLSYSHPLKEKKEKKNSAKISLNQMIMKLQSSIVRCFQKTRQGCWGWNCGIMG